MDIEQRFEKLERQNRHLRLALIGLVGLAVVAVVMGQVTSKPAGQEAQEKVPDVIKAKAFVMVDESGVVRGRMSVVEDAAFLDLYNGSGQRRVRLMATPRILAGLVLGEVGESYAELVVSQNTPSLKLYDKAGVRAGLEVREDESVLILFAEPHNIEARLDASPYGSGVSITDEQGNIRALLDVTKDGPALLLYDEEENFRARLHVRNDTAGLMIKDTNDNQRLRLGGGYRKERDGTTTTYPASSIYLFDADEQLIWKAP